MIYEYECEHCKYHFEQKNTVEQRDDAVCIQCGCGASRVFTPPCISIPCGFKTDKFRYNDYQTARAIDRRNASDSERFYPAGSSNRTFEETFREEYKRYR